MIKLNILNLEKFLEVVNECAGKVVMLCPDGERLDINKQYAVQYELYEKYRNNGNFLPLTLKIENSSDYTRIVSYYAANL